VSDQNPEDQAAGYADSHDLDKLVRWKSDLSTVEKSEFPIYAAFLVSGEDRYSHDVFRRYRSAFAELGAGFHHLVIFGQHGTSTTLLSFLPELSLAWENVPVLTLTASPTSSDVVVIALPKGTGGQGLESSDPWGQALDRIRNASRGGTSLDLAGLDGVTHQTLTSGALVSAVDRVLESIGAD
jgi:hypothetical protein